MKKVIVLILLLLVTLPTFSLAVHVKGYTKKDGTVVQPYERSDPNDTVTDNYSFKGNINPYTGEEGHNYYRNNPSSPYYNSGGSLGYQNIGQSNYPPNSENSKNNLNITNNPVNDSEVLNTAEQKYKKYHFFIVVAPAEEYKGNITITSENDLLNMQNKGARIKNWGLFRGDMKYCSPYDFAVLVNDDECVRAIEPLMEYDNYHAVIAPWLEVPGFLIGFVGCCQIAFDPTNYDANYSYRDTEKGQANLSLGTGVFVAGAIIGAIENTYYQNTYKAKLEEYNLKYTINYYANKMDVYNGKMKKDLGLTK